MPEIAPQVAADVDTGFDIALVRSTDGGTTWTKAADAVEFDVPGASADTYDATHKLSPHGFKEKGKGLLQMDEFTVTVQFSDLTAGLANWYADLKSKDPVFYGFEMPGDTDGTPSLWLAAHCTGVTPKTPNNDRQTAEIRLEPTGKGSWV